MDITSELTIVIPVRIDCEERKVNLDTVLRSLLKTTDCPIIILEADIERRYFFAQQDSRVEYIFIQDNAHVFHRTLYLNKLLKTATTNIVGVWDTDVLLRSSQIRDAAISIKNGITLCYPYDGRFLALSAKQSNEVRSDVIHFLEAEDNENHVVPMIGRPSVGGAFVVNKRRYLNVGGENENFYDWGPEDAERLKRMEILQEPLEHISGALFHLHHPRNINPASADFQARDKHNVNEFIKICRMNEAELWNYINTWEWKS